MAITMYPPGPKGKPVVGHLIDFRRDPAGFLQRLARAYGDIAHFKLGPIDVFLLNRPEYIKDVLVTNYRNFVKSRGLARLVPGHPVEIQPRITLRPKHGMRMRLERRKGG